MAGASNEEYALCATNLADGPCPSHAAFIVSQKGNGWEKEGGQPACFEHVAQVMLCHSRRHPMEVRHATPAHTVECNECSALVMDNAEATGNHENWHGSLDGNHRDKRLGPQHVDRYTVDGTEVYSRRERRIPWTDGTVPPSGWEDEWAEVQRRKAT